MLLKLAPCNDVVSPLNVCLCAADDISVTCDGRFIRGELVALCTKKSLKATFDWSSVAWLWQCWNEGMVFPMLTLVLQYCIYRCKFVAYRFVYINVTVDCCRFYIYCWSWRRVMQVWLPLQPKEDKSKNKGFLSKRIMLPFAVDIYPLGTLSPSLPCCVHYTSLINAFRRSARKACFCFLKFCSFNLMFNTRIPVHSVHR